MKTRFLSLTQSEKDKRAALPRAPRPHLAACLLLYQGPKDNPRLLMGQRASGHDFMPSIYVFPGGRVDRADSFVPVDNGYSARTARILKAALTPARARALGLAALRETYEETGLMLGAQQAWPHNINNESWDTFRRAAIMPDLSSLDVIGRAITPPHRHKRFDTWFFAQRYDGELANIGDSKELLNVGWYNYDELLQLDHHQITQFIFQHFAKDLAAGNWPDTIFFSHMQRGQFKIGRFPN